MQPGSLHAKLPVADLLGLRDFCCHCCENARTHTPPPAILAATCPISADEGRHISVMMGGSVCVCVSNIRAVTPA